MKRNIFIFFNLLFFFLFLLKTGLSAQVTYFQIPGVSCGVAGDIQTNKCCAPFKFEPAGLPDLGTPLRLVRDLVLGPGFTYIKSFSKPIEDYQNKLLKPCLEGTPTTSDAADINCRCELTTQPAPAALIALQKFCDNQTGSGDRSKCSVCIKGGGVWTGIGCVQGSLSSFISQTVFGWGIGLAGGLALLCIIYAAFQMQSSQGNPEKLKKAQEMITSCIMGLMLIIFSIFILRLIGVNILQIPGFK